MRNTASMEQKEADCPDFDWAFNLNRLALDLTGIWPDEKGERNLRYLRAPFMALWVLLGLTLPQMWALRLVSDELPLVVDNVTINATVVTATLKLLSVWRRRKFFKQVVKQARTDYARSRESWECEVMTKQARRARLFTIGCYMVMLSSLVAFLTLPIFGFHIRTVNNITDLDGYVVPLQTYYPYDMSVPPNFQLTFVIQFFAAAFSAVAFSMPDNFFGALVFHASGQFEILNQKIAIMNQNMVPIVDSKYTKSKGSNCVNCVELKQAIRTHIRLIRFVDSIQATFNLPLVLQVLCLSIVMCCLGYGLIHKVKTGGKLPPLFQVVSIGGSLCNTMLHMFIYCIASEILVEHSGAVLNSVYRSNWYSSASKYSRDLIMIMMRSKNPLQITAGKVMNLSLNAYLNILKSSAGYVSMLLAVSGF